MKRLIPLLLCAALLLLLPACAGQGTEDDPQESDLSAVSSAVEDASDIEDLRGGSLTLYTWSLMVPQTVIDDFTEETGITVNYQEFDEEQTMLTRLGNGQRSQYDLVICNDSTMEQIIADDMAQKLDTGKLTNWHEINPLFQSLSFDPEDEYTVPYGAAVQSIVYDPESVGEITGWEDLWSGILKEKLGIVPNAQMVVGMALKATGSDYFTSDETALLEAKNKLTELLPNVKMTSEMELPQRMADGEIAAAVMYPTQAVATVLANDNLKLVYPKEGTGFGVQEAFIPTGAEHAAEAHAFLNYLLRPEIAVRCFEYLGMVSTNTGADSLFSATYAPVLALPKNYTALEQLQTDPTVQDEVTRIWTEFQAKFE